MKMAFVMNHSRRIVRSKAFIIGVACILVYTLAGFFLAPYLIRHYLPRTIRDNLGKQAELGKVTLNPYLFKLEMRAFRMTEPDGRPLIAFERLFADLEMKSLFKWAWVFRDIQLDRPAIQAVLQKEGGLNLANLAPPSAAQPPKDPAESQPPRLIFENIRIAEGQLTFTDQRPSQPATLTLAPVEAAFGHLTTLPANESATDLSATSAKGETLKWQGQVGLNPLTVKGHIHLQKIQSATLAAFAGDMLRLAPPSGTLAAESDCAIDNATTGARIELSNLSVLLNGIALALPEAPKPFLELPDARLTGGHMDLTGRKIDLGTIAVQGGSARLAMNDQGVLNLQRLIAPSKQGSEKPKQPTQKKPSDKPWTLKLGGFTLDRFAAAYEDPRHAPGLKGTIGNIKAGFTAEAQTGAHLSARVKDAMLRLSDVKAGFAGAEPAIRVGVISLEKATADLPQKRLTAGKIAIEGGAVEVERKRDGSLNLAQLFGLPKQEAAATQPDTAEAAPKADRPPAIDFLVDRVSLSGMRATLWDRTVRDDQPILQAESIAAGASKVNGRSPMPVDVAVDIREGGRIKATGMLDPAAQSLTAEVEVASLALTPFQPYIARVATVVLQSGAFSSTGKLSHGVPGAEARTIYQGGFKVENLRMVETDNDETVIGWKSVLTDQLQLRLQPNVFEIGDLRVRVLGGKAIVEKDGSFNLANLIKADGPTQSASGEKQAEPLAYRVRRVLINDGRIEFADRRLLIPFATHIHALRGNLAGITSAKDSRSQLRFRGRVDEFGTAEGEGEINTSNPKMFTDIKLAFRNVEMSSLTPYSGKFAGRAIDAGKLSIDLAYAVDSGQLTGENKIVVEQLKLGKNVESPDAVDLPLDLAVALLQNTKGVIDLGLPVKGDLNNPQFNFSALIGKALLNLLKKVATSPFRALGALIPGGDEKTLKSVTFAPGRTTVPPPEKEKLLQLAEAMGQRPQLKLVVQGRYHPEQDRQALARRNLRRAVTGRLGQTLEPDEAPGPLDYSSSETRDVLEEMFVQAFGEDALDAFEDEMKNAHKEDKARDAGFVAKALFDRLQAAEAVPEERLVELAQARAEAVIAEIKGAKGLSADQFGTREPAALEAAAPIEATLSLEAR